MKKKAFCQRCGHTHQSSTLRKEIHGSRLLCPICYSFKNRERLKAQLDSLPDLTPKDNKLYTNTNYFGKKPLLSKGEEEFLKKKYGYDRNNANGKPFTQLDRLKKALRLKKKKPVEVTHKTDLNESFLGGLK